MPDTVPHSSTARLWLSGLLLGVLVAIAFYPALSGSMTTYDDDRHLTSNPRMNPPSLAAVTEYWKRPFLGLYIPVTYTAWSAISVVARRDVADANGVMLDALPFHLANLLCHVANTLLLWFILRRLVSSGWPALLGAAIFAVHPLQTEPVSWVSGLRDVLGATLALAAIAVQLLGDKDVSHAHIVKKPSPWFRVASVFLFLLAVLAKPTVAVLPLMVAVAVLLLQRRRLRDVVIPSLPMLLIGALALLLAKAVQPGSTLPSVPLFSRPLLALDAVGFYLAKLVVPLGLTIDYGHTPLRIMQEGSITLTPFYPLIAALLAGAAWKWTRAPAVGLLLFVLALVPVLGFASFEFQRISTVADRYVYLAMIGVAVAIAGIAIRLPRWLGMTLWLAVAAIRF